MSIQKGYIRDAFGSFDPTRDQDAATKFCVESILMDRNFDLLAHLLDPKCPTKAISGDPGWEIEQRTELDGGWPPDAMFRSFVDPDGYRLSFPEHYCDRETFIHYLKQGVTAYLRRHPDRDAEVAQVQAFISD